ncbi:hypothetical protein ASZ90_016251 [hydrocarbon metagenome]|uniref:Uncharacterized protein n=1 Tax=hydrocarbon metagenome TaxID=938273 RepID=A0A0W8EZR6_9ZZZZ
MYPRLSHYRISFPVRRTICAIPAIADPQKNMIPCHASPLFQSPHSAWV